MIRRKKAADRTQWPDDPVRVPMAGFHVTVPRLALGTRRMTLAERNSFLQRRLELMPVLTERREWTSSALLVRVAQVIAGLAVLLLAPHIRTLVAVLLLLGLLAAVVSPSRTGQAIAVGAGIADWVLGYGSHGTPSLVRVLAFALALYALHDSTSLASTVPITAELRREALLAWLRRSGVALLLAGLLIAVVYGIGGLVNFTTSYPLEVAGLFGIVAALGVTAWLFSRSLR